MGISIGDCELLILLRTEGRHNPLELVFHTEMQRIDGNAQAPLQVARVDGRVDPNFDERITHDVINRGSSVHCMSAYEGDIVIAGSDGVFDNVFIDEIVAIANQYLSPSRGMRGEAGPSDPNQLEQIARRVVAECHRKTERLPNGEQQDAPIGKGGKIDDTCCVVGEVIEWTKQHSARWTKIQRQRAAKNSSAFCSLSDGAGPSLLAALGQRLFGSDLVGCMDRNGSDYGSDYGTEVGSECVGSDYDGQHGNAAAGRRK